MCRPSACGEMSVKPWFLSLREILFIVNLCQEQVVERSGSGCAAQELPGGRCMSALPVLLWEGSSAHSCGFVAFLSSWPWIAVLLLLFPIGFFNQTQNKTD